MAAFEPPMMADEFLSTDAGPDYDGIGDSSTAEPTLAVFSPVQQTTTRSRNRASILIHQKSPLVTATPPPVTRALAHSHPVILPLNYVAGLLTWSTGDPWESFLLLAGFWFSTLYGGTVIRLGGPVVFISVVMVGLYSRRYNPLSRKNWAVAAPRTTATTGEETSSPLQQRKSLDEILEVLQTFASRCEVLTDPFLRLTEFLTTQTASNEITTRPALFSLFIRLAAITPLWMALTLPSIAIITTNRVVLVVGTVVLTWHSLPARASRTILWRNKSIRMLVSLLTGLHLPLHSPPPDASVAPPLVQQVQSRTAQTGAGVRFTFSIFENQRRWIGLGYSGSMLPSDRKPWTDEHLNACDDKDDFPLPETEFASLQWQWAPGSRWRIDRSWTDDYTTVKGKRDPEGWTYYDNQWDYASVVNAWGKYTRRRRWVRDAELVETKPAVDPFASTPKTAADSAIDAQSVADTEDNSSRPASGVTTPTRKRGWFKRRTTLDRTHTADKSDTVSINGSISTSGTMRSRDSPEDDVHTPLRFRDHAWDRSMGDGLVEGLS